ncbi:WD40-repeat-containing domain protein [Lobosporangium transversale]|uniref:WD40-repeat-containing domain protein n=1 Tax=Lobosporangium transversale TaxID=64571 RepID=A0A1Y2GVD6_9FUNG|nr:WD40-repeat-containing domain protein [Lobosporangium transversale]ORZ22922.1 WD40-repeat-containing domain protein [Lobosporangium transversale]|eukprot:XP_021883476.1 WD40-repeat-containing domain protein [Lobosporangium transversale]
MNSRRIRCNVGHVKNSFFQLELGLVRPDVFQKRFLNKRITDIVLDPSTSIERAHTGAVNTIDIEEAEARYLISGGGDGSIHVYDLDESEREERRIIKSIASVNRSDDGHRGGVSRVRWYPFDNGMFTTSSFDSTIKVWDTNAMEVACTFDLANKVYSHAMSSKATHGLIATASADPRIRLCDLKTGAYTHSLSGHRGTVLSVEWSPRHDYLLASGSTDTTVRLWDIRKSSSCLCSLDLHNSASPPLAESNSAHTRAVNGVSFTPDGLYLVTTGHDDKMRLWNLYTGQNTLTNYGTMIRNQFVHNLSPLISPLSVAPPSSYYVFHPSDDRSILMFDLMDGSLVKRLTGSYGRVTALAWRPRTQEIYSAGNDHDILVWSPKNIDRNNALQALADQDTWSDSDSD